MLLIRLTSAGEMGWHTAWRLQNGETVGPGACPKLFQVYTVRSAVCTETWGLGHQATAGRLAGVMRSSHPKSCWTLDATALMTRPRYTKRTSLLQPGAQGTNDFAATHVDAGYYCAPAYATLIANQYEYWPAPGM